LGKTAVKPLELIVSAKRDSAQLYSEYAVLFPEFKLLWDELAQDERRCASQVEKVLEEYACQATPVTGLPGMKAAECLCGLLKKELALLPEPRLSLLHALSAAFEVEQYSIGAFNFEGADGISDRLKHGLRRIRSVGAAHLEQVRLAMAKFS
jgi:hypothetical protein